MKRIAAGIIGMGNIGSELEKKLKENGWGVIWTTDSKGIYDGSKRVGDIDQLEKFIGKVQITFLAIPTLDEGPFLKEERHLLIRPMESRAWRAPKNK